MREKLWKLVPKPIRRRIDSSLWESYRAKIESPLLFHPWERREFMPFLESVKDKLFEDFTTEEVEKMRQLGTLLIERGLRLTKRGLGL